MKYPTAYHSSQRLIKLYEFTDNHHPARQNNHVHGDFRDPNEYDGGRTFHLDVCSRKERTTVD